MSLQKKAFLTLFSYFLLYNGLAAKLNNIKEIVKILHTRPPQESGISLKIAIRKNILLLNVSIRKIQMTYCLCKSSCPP